MQKNRTENKYRSIFMDNPGNRNNYHLSRIEQVRINVNRTRFKGIYATAAETGYIVISAFVPQIEGVNFRDDKEWFEFMTERTKDLRQLIKRSKYKHTQVWADYMYENNDSSSTNTSVKQISFILFNITRKNITRGVNPTTTIKEFGQKWCQIFGQKSFLYVPGKEQNRIDNPEINPAYLIDGHGKTLDVFSSIAPVLDIDNFFKLLNREINADNSPENHFTYQDGVLYFGRGPRGMFQHVRRDGECYCSIIG